MADLVTVYGRGGVPFTVNAADADRWTAFLNDPEWGDYGFDKKQSGGYNPRNIAGTNTPSQHAFGRAIDINWTNNARGTRGDIDPDLARRLAARHGLTWGGDWKNPDPMHFEVAGNAPSQPLTASLSSPKPPGSSMALTYSPQSGGTFDSYQGDTPEEVQRKAALAQALMGQASSTEPVRHWTQALARVFAGANAGLLNSQAEEARKAGGASVLRALTSPGETQDKIAALAATPWGQDMAKQLALHSIEAGMPKFGKIGTDPFLGDQMGWINQGKQTITPAVPQQPQTPEGGAAPGAVNSSSLAPLANLTGQEFLDKLGPVLGPNGPAVVNKIKNIAEGREKPLPELRNSTNQQIMRWVAQYDPTFDAALWPARNKTATEFSPGGKQGQNFNSIAMVANHATAAADAIDALGNMTTAPILNVPRNMVRGQLSPEYQAALAKFETARTTSITEIAKALRGAGAMNQEELHNWESKFNANSSPVTMRAALNEAVELLMGRLEPQIYSYNQTMGKNKTLKDFVPPETINKMRRLQGLPPLDKDGNEPPAAAPNAPQAAPGAVSAPPPPEFIKAAQSAGIPPDKAATIPENGFIANPKTGQKFWRINNKLVDEKQLQAQEPPPAPPQVPNPLSNFDSSGQFTGPR